MNGPDFDRAFARAMALGHARRLSACAELCATLRRARPQSCKVLELLAWVRFEAHEFNECIDAARAALLLEPDNGVAHGLLGRAYERTGRLDEAIEHLERCATLPDPMGEARARYVRVLARKEPHRARLLVREGASAESASGRALHQWLRAATALDERDAIERFAAALAKKAPNDGYFRASVAAAMLKLERYGEAREHAIAAIRAQPNLALAWTVRAVACAKLGLTREQAECGRALSSARSAKA